MTNTSISLLEKYLGFSLCALLSAFRWITGPFTSKSSASKASKKIVFVKFIEQGALVLHQASFREAARQYGANNIYLCTFASNAPLIDLLKLVPAENVIYINEKSLLQFTLGFIKALAKIRRAGIDTAIDLEFYSNATAIFCYLTGAAKRAGYHRYMGSQNYRGDLFTHRLSYSHYVHVAESSWCLLKSLELPVEALPALDIPTTNFNVQAGFTPTEADRNHLNQLLGGTSNSKGLIVVNPSLNDVLPLRRWPEESFRKFVQLFNERYPGHTFVFTGRPDETELTNSFIASLQVQQAINLCGKTGLNDILTLYTSAKLLLTSDSGPAHFATLTPVHSIVLFGPETPVLYGPLSERSQVIYKAIPCSPCYNVYNNRQSSCSNNICMKKITVEEVLAAADKVMQASDN